MKRLTAFSMPDRTTWVGQWNQDAGVLEDIVVLETPVFRFGVSDTYNPSGYVHFQMYCADLYRCVELEKRAHRWPWHHAERFDPSKAIAEWNLQEDYELTMSYEHTGDNKSRGET